MIVTNILWPLSLDQVAVRHVHLRMQFLYTGSVFSLDEAATRLKSEWGGWSHVEYTTSKYSVSNATNPTKAMLGAIVIWH